MKKLRLVLWAAVVVFATAAVVIALNRGRSTTAPSASASPQAKSGFEGKPPPSLSLQDLDGKPSSADRFRGQPVVMNFWATWCIPCRAEMPDIEHEARAWAGKATFVGVDDAEDVPTIRTFTQDLGITYQIWRDPDGQVEKVFNAPGLPYTVFLDAQGNVQVVYLGQMSRDYMEQQLRHLAGS